MYWMQYWNPMASHGNFKIQAKYILKTFYYSEVLHVLFTKNNKDFTNKQKNEITKKA